MTLIVHIVTDISTVHLITLKEIDFMTTPRARQANAHTSFVTQIAHPPVEGAADKRITEEEAAL